MRAVFYQAQIGNERREVQVVPDQVELVVHAMQRLHTPRIAYTVESIRAEYNQWYKRSNHPPADAHLWISDRAIQAVIDAYQYR